MGFNKRKLEDQRRTAAEKEAASRRATDAQVLEDAEMPGVSVRQCQRFASGENQIPATVVKLLECLLEVAKR